MQVGTSSSRRIFFKGDFESLVYGFVSPFHIAWVLRITHFGLKKEPHFNQNVEKQSYIDFECFYCLQYLSVVFKVGSEGDMA